VELARQLILLSGLKPDEDIRIQFVGLRPGEKLYEELQLADERMVATGHEKIMVFAGNSLPFEQAIRHLAALRKACENRDLRAMLLEFKDLVPDYNPSKELLQRVLEPDLARMANAVTAADCGIAPVAGGLSPASVT